MTDLLDDLATTLRRRRSANPESSYVAQLHSKGLNAILEKVGEESTETIIAAKDGDRAGVIRETADLWFHTMVMLDHFGASALDVLGELERRLGVSGLEEKASRPDPCHNPLEQETAS